MRTSRLASATAVLALCVGLVGCSGDDKDKDKDGADKASQDASASAGVDPSRVSPTDLPKVPEVSKGKGAVADATFGECATGAGKQKVTGSVTNGTKKTTDYVVTISWVNDTSDVLTRGVAVVEDLDAGQAKDFEITADVPDGVSTCTFHVVRGSLS